MGLLLPMFQRLSVVMLGEKAQRRLKLSCIHAFEMILEEYQEAGNYQHYLALHQEA